MEPFIIEHGRMSEIGFLNIIEYIYQYSGFHLVDIPDTVSKSKKYGKYTCRASGWKYFGIDQDYSTLFSDYLTDFHRAANLMSYPQFEGLYMLTIPLRLPRQITTETIHTTSDGQKFTYKAKALEHQRNVNIGEI